MRGASLRNLEAPAGEKASGTGGHGPRGGPVHMLYPLFTHPSNKRVTIEVTHNDEEEGDLKIYRKIVIDIASGRMVEETSYE